MTSVALLAGVSALACTKRPSDEPAERTEVPAQDVASAARPADTDVDVIADDDDPFQQWYGLCEADSEALDDARQKYEAFAAVVEAIDPAGEAPKFEKELQALLRHECFAVATADIRATVELSHGVEVRHFWDSGLDSWLQQFLDLAAGTDSTAWTRPTRRRAWTPTTHPDDPLASFLCAAGDEHDACAQRVRPWMMRAERFFELWAKSTDDRDCDDVARTAAPREAYRAWSDCIEEQEPRGTAMPLGGLGVVDQGWLVVEGRRGHYQFCDGVAAYDLATGAAYRFDSCGGLVLHLDGDVDHDQTDAERSPSVEVGAIPVHALQEAAWATLSAPHVDTDVPLEGSRGRALPTGIEVGRQGLMGKGLGLSVSTSTAHTRLSWRWVTEDERSTTGTLSWPGDLNDPAGDHATRLLAIAEAQHRPGCAPAALPGWLATQMSRSLAKTSGTGAALSALVRAQAGRRCGPGSP